SAQTGSPLFRVTLLQDTGDDRQNLRVETVGDTVSCDLEASQTVTGQQRSDSRTGSKRTFLPKEINVIDEAVDNLFLFRSQVAEVRIGKRGVERIQERTLVAGDIDTIDQIFNRVTTQVEVGSVGVVAQAVVDTIAIGEAQVVRNVRGFRVNTGEGASVGAIDQGELVVDIVNGVRALIDMHFNLTAQGGCATIDDDGVVVQAVFSAAHTSDQGG